MGAIRYKSRFESIAGHKYVVNIWDDEWEGSEGEFCLGPDGFSLSYEGSTEDMFKAFIPSRMEFVFNVQSSAAETFVYQLAQSKPSRFKIFVTDGGASGTDSLYWQGFVQGEGIQITDEYYPYEVTLAAGDIGFFKDVEFSENNAPVTGYYDAVEIIDKVLDITGHSAFITTSAHSFDDLLHTSMEWRASGMASAGDPLTLVEIDAATYYDRSDDGTYIYDNCQEVVQSIAQLFGCRFFQSGGRFRLAQIDNLVETGQQYYEYSNAAETASGTADARKTIDRIELFETAGGSWSFVPGLKHADREYLFRRNWMQGVTCNQSAPLSYIIGDIPAIKNLDDQNQPARYTLKFNLQYKIVRVPDRSNSEDALDSWTRNEIGNVTSKYLDLVPLWRMQLYGTGQTSGKTYYYSQSMSEQPGVGMKVNDYSWPWVIKYRRLVDSKTKWEWEYTQPLWREYTSGSIAEQDRVDFVNDDVKYFEIIDEDYYRLNISNDGFFVSNGLPTSKYIAESKTISVELNISAKVGDLSEGFENLTMQLDLYDIFNDHEKEWATEGPAKDLADYVKWSVESFEFIVHGNNVEDKPETGRKYRVASPDGFRRTDELPSNKLLSLDKRTWHHIRVVGGTGGNCVEFWAFLTDEDGEPIVGTATVDISFTVDGVPDTFTYVGETGQVFEIYCGVGTFDFEITDVTTPESGVFINGYGYNLVGTTLDIDDWYRPNEAAKELNFLSVEQAVAMNRSGLRLYQGGLISKADTMPLYHNTLVKGSTRYMIVQGTIVPKQDEWNNLQAIELTRNIANLTYQELKSKSAAPSGSSLPGGNYSTNNYSTTGETAGGGVKIPEYEFASGLNGGSYTVQNIQMSGSSGLSDDALNTYLMVFQDATKLSYPMGYTIDWANNEINFTYDLEDATLEIYYYG